MLWQLARIDLAIQNEDDMQTWYFVFLSIFILTACTSSESNHENSTLAEESHEVMREEGQENWLIDPERGFGFIGKKTSKEDLIQQLGQKQVRDTIVDFEDGTPIVGTLVYFEDPRDTLRIVWAQKDARIKSIHLDQSSERWKTKGGVQVGDSIRFVEKVNGSYLSFRGFAVDSYEDGRVVSWTEGALEGLDVQFKPDPSTSVDLYKSMMGPFTFSSNDEAIYAANLRVSSISVSF